jgi:transposase InsO family protein
VTYSTTSSIPTSSSPLHLRNVLVAPSLVKNLISVWRLTRDNNVSIEFDPTGFSIKDLPMRGDLYPLRVPAHQALAASSSLAVSLWHQRLGHPGHHVLSQVLANFNFSCNKSVTHSYSSCRLGKHVQLPFSNSTSYKYFPFQLLYSNVWTSPIVSNSGYKYYLVVLDDYTHYLWTFPLRHKSEVLPTLCTFLAYVHTQFCLPVLGLQTDNGKEFDSTALRLLLVEHGIQFRLSCPYTSQQNGKAERVLRTLNNCVRTMLLHSAAPLTFWAKALSTATYLINHRPCRATGTTTPFQLLFGIEPSYDGLRIFGCRCFPNTTATNKHKLDARSVLYVFIGYPTDHCRYRCYNPTT